MAQQTAMQHLIKWLEAGWKDEDVESIIKKCNQLLEIEKEQIIDAMLYALDEDGHTGEWKLNFVNNYYNQILNQKK